MQQNSADPRVQTSTFENGTFIVPGRTTAVFVSYEHVEDMIGDLIGQIEDLVDQGVLNNGQGQSLTNMLDRALKELGKGNPQKAIKAMNDFIKRINNLSKRGVLSEETAAQLIKDAQIIIAAIEAGA